jgi:two-component sensor histidine kinase
VDPNMSSQTRASPIRDRDLFGAAIDAQLVFDFDLVILDQNGRHASMTGTRTEDLVGRFMFDAFPKNPDQEGPDTEDIIRASLEEVRRNGVPHRVPVQRHDLRTVEGGFESRYWSITHAPLRRDGEIAAILQVSRDVTAEMRLRARYEAERRAAAAGTGLAYFEYEPESDAFERGAAVDEMFGYALGEVGPVAEPFFARVHPDDLPGVKENVERGMADPEAGTLVFDYRVVIPGAAEPNHVRAIGEMVTPPEGGARRLVGIFVDRTQDIRREEALRAALEAKSGLLAEMNHRIKNSLALAASVLRLQKVGSDGDFQGALQKAAQRINAIATVHGRLYEDGDYRMVDMRQFLEDLTADLTASSGGAELPALDLCALSLPTERAIPVGMVLGELYTNAVKYGAPDGLSVSLSEEAGECRLSVVNKVIERGRDHDLPSTGTGMRLTDAFARQLGGRIEHGPEGKERYRASLIFPRAKDTGGADGSL